MLLLSVLFIKAEALRKRLQQNTLLITHTHTQKKPFTDVYKKAILNPNLVGFFRGPFWGVCVCAWGGGAMVKYYPSNPPPLPPTLPLSKTC